MSTSTTGNQQQGSGGNGDKPVKKLCVTCGKTHAGPCLDKCQLCGQPHRGGARECREFTRMMQETANLRERLQESEKVVHYLTRQLAQSSVVNDPSNYSVGYGGLTQGSSIGSSAGGVVANIQTVPGSNVQVNLQLQKWRKSSGAQAQKSSSQKKPYWKNTGQKSGKQPAKNLGSHEEKSSGQGVAHGRVEKTSSRNKPRWGASARRDAAEQAAQEGRGTVASDEAARTSESASLAIRELQAAAETQVYPYQRRSIRSNGYQSPTSDAQQEIPAPTSPRSPVAETEAQHSSLLSPTAETPTQDVLILDRPEPFTPRLLKEDDDDESSFA